MKALDLITGISNPESTGDLEQQKLQQAVRREMLKLNGFKKKQEGPNWKKISIGKSLNAFVVWSHKNMELAGQTIDREDFFKESNFKIIRTYR